MSGCLAGAATADDNEFRSWVDTHGWATNSVTSLWYGQSGVGGSLMSATPTEWRTTSEAYTWPMIGPLVNIGEYGGTAGPATFNGMWGRPGPRLDAVLVFAPKSDTWVAGMDVHSELISNGMLGDGVTISVVANISGNVTSLGTIVLAHTADARLDHFTFSTSTLLQAGDTLSVVIGNNGSFLYDHVNFNAWVTAPGPGGLAVLAGAVAMGGRRRRR